MSWKSEGLALTFGILLILVTFGDSYLTSSVGNLDAILGHPFWPLLDFLYPLTSITVFLLYGRAKGGLRINTLAIVIFFTYLIALALISLDDIAKILHVSLTLTKDYWISVEWFYPIYSSIALIMFGRINQAEKTKNSQNTGNDTIKPS